MAVKSKPSAVRVVVDSVFFDCVITKVFLRQKPDGAGLPEFTVYFRIGAVYTVLTHVDLVLHTFIAGFSVRMIYTMIQLQFLQ